MTVLQPFQQEIPEEIPLRRAPLVAVIAQVRFPPVTSISRPDFIGPFQEALRDHYPVLRQETGVGILITSQGASAQTNAGVLWRFSDPDNNWQVSLASDFVGLETKHYTSRTEFLDRLNVVLAALERLARPAIVDRIGVRYVNRLGDGAEPDQLRTQVREEILGVPGLAGGWPRVALEHGFSDALFAFDGSQLRARWGFLPPNATLDPSIEPAATASWLLDLDMFRTGPVRYDRATILDLSRSFAERTYTFFRWAFTNEFIRQAAEE